MWYHGLSNTMASHLASCRVIPRPFTMKGWEKEVFWKIPVLGNLKCNKIDNVKPKWNPGNNTWKVTVLTVKLFRKTFQAFPWNYK